jgi:hypothetical protein
VSLHVLGSDSTGLGQVARRCRSVHGQRPDVHGGINRSESAVWDPVASGGMTPTPSDCPTRGFVEGKVEGAIRGRGCVGGSPTAIPGRDQGSADRVSVVSHGFESRRRHHGELDPGQSMTEMPLGPMWKKSGSAGTDRPDPDRSPERWRAAYLAFRKRTKDPNHRFDRFRPHVRPGSVSASEVGTVSSAQSGHSSEDVRPGNAVGDSRRGGPGLRRLGVLLLRCTSDDV